MTMFIFTEEKMKGACAVGL